jgi:integrin alpha FG-GAP repeat containing protein 1
LVSDAAEKFNFEKNTQSVLRVGDINSDSFPDIIAVTHLNNTFTTKVFLNTEIYYPDSYTGLKRRTFSSNNAYALTPNNSDYASFMDLDENGQLDILIVTRDNELVGYFNNYNYDVFFLKSVTLRYKGRFTTNEIGANYRYISTNLDGSRRMDVSFQSAQTNDLSLNLPYTYMGIGRSNNYIENFQVISSTILKRDEDNFKTFTPIIPNSQLIISREISEDRKSSTWELDLIVTPTSKLSLLIMTIIVLLVIILAIIIYLHIKEVVNIT